MLTHSRLKIKKNPIDNNRSIFRILDDINIDIDSKICRRVEDDGVVFNIYVENVDVRSRCKLKVKKVNDNELDLDLVVDEDFNKADYEECLTYSDYYCFIKDILKVIHIL